jgi:indolepyruvate decarboxylase
VLTAIADRLSQATSPERSFVARTAADLDKALSAPNDTLIFIESIMDPFDAPTAVITGDNKGADIDYGPPGPQHRDNMARPAALEGPTLANRVLTPTIRREHDVY